MGEQSKTRPKGMREKKGGGPLPDPTAPMATARRVVACRTTEAEPVVGAMTWPAAKLTDGELSLDAFCSSLAEVRQELGARRAADLMLCAGAKIQQDQLRDDDVAARVWAAWGRPILFEMPALDGRKRWVLVDDGKITDVRADQYVFRDKDVALRSPATVGELTTGAGVLDLTRGDVVVRRFVLFICAEANLMKVKFTGQRSVVAPGFGSNVPELFSGPWVLLHPAHHPYWPHIGHKGFCLVGSMRSKVRTRSAKSKVRTRSAKSKKWNHSVPLFTQLVNRREAYADGSTAPDTVVHAAPFHDGTDARKRPDKDFATLRFSRGAVTHEATVQVRALGKLAAHYTEFAV